MTQRRFYAPPAACSDDRRSVTLSADEARHLRKVLRLRAGDEVNVFDGEGKEYRGLVNEIAGSSARVDLIEAVEAASPESPLQLTLAVALLKGEKFDLVVQKATELGVRRLISIITTRADVKIKSAHDADRKIARWQRIALEATKQCGRALLMKVDKPALFADLIKHADHAGGELRLMFSERGGEPLQLELRAGQHSRSVTALVGSEGGWTDEEIAQARVAGWEIVTLGGRILRAETAAITIPALLQHRLGDLK